MIFLRQKSYSKSGPSGTPWGPGCTPQGRYTPGYGAECRIFIYKKIYIYEKLDFLYQKIKEYNFYENKNIL